MKELKDLIEAAKTCHDESMVGFGMSSKTLKKLRKAITSAETALKRMENTPMRKGGINNLPIKPPKPSTPPPGQYPGAEQKALEKK